jgi:hypothetical protein
VGVTWDVAAVAVGGAVVAVGDAVDDTVPVGRLLLVGVADGLAMLVASDASAAVGENVGLTGGTRLAVGRAVGLCNGPTMGFNVAVAVGRAAVP